MKTTMNKSYLDLIPSGKVLGRRYAHGALAFGAALAGALALEQTVCAKEHDGDLGTIFVIAMENHNFTQPATQTSPQPIFGNPAAPFMNSLITSGNPNAAQVSYATAYYNAGFHVHPSEPNYVWAEAGTDFAVHTDADPAAANGNIFYDQALHLTGQFDGAGITWKNYQEDVQLSLSPTNSASGNNGPINPFYGTGQFNYAVKHNPMAFFADSAVQNVFPLAQFFDDLRNNTLGRYNWITPNQFNDAHSALSGGFTYNGTHFTGDAANIAQGDNFLSQIIPQIMASPAYKRNGVIVIWWDESEGGDDVSRTIPEIIISPLAKGNAYASGVPMSHSSDIKTWEEIFRLPEINNPIPLDETNVFGGYENVATVNDLSDLFVPGTIRAPSFKVEPGFLVHIPRTQTYSQLVRVTNTGSAPAPAPLWLVLDNLSPNATLLNEDGTTSVLAPLGSPFVNIQIGEEDEVLAPHETRIVRLQFADPSGTPVTYDSRVLNVIPAP
ncbi:MAG TPA: alkaline phosphatase family protein [Verrucomicrobiae bacterium]|nr:alkaline phosphatase family protein [Verrucomicrobiae bacterium]